MQLLNLSAISAPLKRGLKVALSQSAISSLARRSNGGGWCLMYHRVFADNKPRAVFSPNANIAVTRANFERQIKFISQNFNCLHLSTAVELIERNVLPQDAVVVTFDDGYRDNLTLALPVLEQFGVPATIYITTGLINATANPWWYEHESLLASLERLELTVDGAQRYWVLRTADQKRMAFHEINQIFTKLSHRDQEQLLATMREQVPSRKSYAQEMLSWEEIAELAKHPLITIGAHTDSHPVMSQLSDKELRREVLEPKRRIEEHIGQPVEHFAYPFGGPFQANAREHAAVRDAGFRSAVTTVTGNLATVTGKDLWSLPRVAIDYYDRMSDFRWKLSGFETLLRRGVG